MTGFKPQTSGVGSNCFANWATPLPKGFTLVCLAIKPQLLPYTKWKNYLENYTHYCAYVIP